MIKHAKMISLLAVLAALVAFMFLRAGGVKAAPVIRVKAWKVVSSPNLGAYRNNLNGIIAISSSDVWAVGNFAVSNSSSSRTLTEHWDGQQWSIVPSPNVGSNDNLFTSVAAISTTDIWAAGIGN